MDLITKADEDLYQVIRLSLKFGRTRKLLTELERAYQDGWQNPRTSLAYALAALGTLYTVKTEVDAHAGYNGTIEALDDVLAAAPDHWLARYCRARLRALVPNEYGVFTIYVEHERSQARKDLAELLDRQSQAPWQPYFASAFVLAAQLDHLTGDETARADLIARAAAPPVHAVGLPHLGTMLCEPFVWLYDKVDDAERTTLGRLMAALFPEQPAVVTALSTYPVK